MPNSLILHQKAVTIESERERESVSIDMQRSRQIAQAEAATEYRISIANVFLN